MMKPGMRRIIVDRIFLFRLTVALSVCFVAGIAADTHAAQGSRQAVGSAAATDQDIATHQQSLETAEALFASAFQPESIELFSQLIVALESQFTRSPLPDDARQILTQSLLLRAEAQFNLTQTDAATKDMQQAIDIDPSIQLDTSRVSPRFVDLFDSLLAESVGYLVLLVSPPDAEVRLDGTVVDTVQLRHPLLTGPHTLIATRPGYDAMRVEVVIEAAAEVQSGLSLQATSAVVRLLTRPPGADVSLNTATVGRTTGIAHGDIVLPAHADQYPLEEFSDELVIDGLQIGLNRIEVTLDGFRTSRHEVDVRGLADYRAVVVLEPTEGRVLLEDLPEDAVVSVNDVVTTPEPPSSDKSASMPFLKLSVGEHRITVDGGTRGLFTTDVDVADQDSLIVPVRVRPTIAFLGVLGGDEIGAQTVKTAIDETLNSLDEWLLLDHTNRGPETLREAGGTLEGLRALSTGQPMPDETFNWNAIQTAVDEQLPGSVYVLGVLSNDLVATHADIWAWLAAPSPSHGHNVRVPLNGTDTTLAITQALAPELVMERPWLGSLLIDSNAVDGAIVATVTPESPSADAGIQIGDVLVAINADEIRTVADAKRLLSNMSPNETVTLSINRNETLESLELVLGTSPILLSFNDDGVLHPVLIARLSALIAADTQSDTNWIIRLHRAEALLKTGATERAVQEFRAIQAGLPAEPQRAAVNYRLGVALETLGPTYLEAARQAFRRAANVADARLVHNDGPWGALRALVRLRELSEADPQD
jgi:hypothetical protein